MKVLVEGNIYKQNLRHILWTTFFCISCRKEGGGLTKSKSFGTLFAKIWGELGCTKVYQKFQKIWLSEKCPKRSQKIQNSWGGVRPVLDKIQIKAAFFCWERPLPTWLQCLVTCNTSFKLKSAFSFLFIFQRKTHLNSSVCINLWSAPGQIDSWYTVLTYSITRWSTTLFWWKRMEWQLKVSSDSGTRTY